MNHIYIKSVQIKLCNLCDFWDHLASCLPLLLPYFTDEEAYCSNILHLFSQDPVQMRKVFIVSHE